MRYALSSLILVLIFTANSALSGERIEFYAKHINVSTASETMEVGDEPGHILAFFSAKGVGTRLEGPEEHPIKSRSRAPATIAPTGAVRIRATASSSLPTARIISSAGREKSRTVAPSAPPPTTAAADVLPG